MHIKKIALHAMVLGMAALSVMATDQPIDWEAPCTGDAVIANWVSVRSRLYIYINGGWFGIDGPTRSKVFNLLDGYYLPPVIDLDIFRKVADIVGPNFMQLALGTFLDNYWAAHPCVNPTPTISSSTSSVDSSSTGDSSTISSDTSTSDSDSTSSSDSSSSDINSTISSGSSSNDVSSSYITTSIYSSTSVEPTSTTTAIYSSTPTSLYSTIPPHKCYVTVVVTSRVTPACSTAY
ncbi:hypothetical protein GGI24_000605 [Coemansia furcata]|nr:hypothetical protein GGI24_000605 [Coemansia furcata]